MFALALWDSHINKLILARDRLGEKPLFYYHGEQVFVFGSELKSILKHPAVKKEIDWQSLAKYLIYEYVPAPHSIFRNIKKLEPGQFLVYQNDRIELKTYWDISFDKFPITLSKKQYLEEFEKRFEKSVKNKLVADVPLGIFLSGGIDSAAIAYFAQKNSPKTIKTFSIGFSDSSFDESSYSRQAAEFFKSDHYQQILEPRDCLALIPQIADFLDEPMADASIIPTYLLSRFTREKVTVALSGDGGDELLMGYPTYQAYKLAKIYQKLPDFIKQKLVPKIVNSLPSSFNNISIDFMLKRFVSGYQYGPEVRNQIWLGSFMTEQIKDLLNPDLYHQLLSKDYFEDIENYLDKIKQELPENRLIYLYLKNYLQDDILVKTDRASMAMGLETRAPFLDHKLVDFINALPLELKLHGWQTKYIFKEIMKDKIPLNIVYRKKKGFGIPIAKWLKKELRSYALGLFDQVKIDQEGFFNYSYIKQLLDQHFSGQRDNRKLLWTLMIFEIWFEKWGN